ncbi:hypothetical protein C7C46_32600 [Streptomyces tateyamensis]|uniref:Uncharacterized protein n=1 Tax=Streptomyces tateyamensis TaxID=565073 RepID=A0A2V4NSX6_9ACTN|nr:MULTISPECIES: hypothetical protein [Streptomycetaceae]MDH6134914.1 hypothetical protein [Kitasatospora sp. MAA4]PYC65445.1 hypothetical protein C7C46_32600 [Streptomyces tateyamensis]
MSVQPIEDAGDSVPRNAEGIAAALSGARRMEFYRELLAAAPQDAEAVLRRWWCEAVLDVGQARGDQLTAAALAGTLPLRSVASVIEHRRAAGLPVE